MIGADMKRPAPVCDGAGLLLRIVHYDRTEDIFVNPTHRASSRFSIGIISLDSPPSPRTSRCFPVAEERRVYMPVSAAWRTRTWTATWNAALRLFLSGWSP